MRVEWTPAAVEARNEVVRYLVEESDVLIAEAVAIGDKIRDFSYTLADFPALTALAAIAASEDGAVTYHEVAVRKSKRFKLLYRLKAESPVIEIIYVRSTAQNIDPKAVAAEYQAGLL